jgi:hypothetical protein
MVAWIEIYCLFLQKGLQAGKQGFYNAEVIKRERHMLKQTLQSIEFSASSQGELILLQKSPLELSLSL